MSGPFSVFAIIKIIRHLWGLNSCMRAYRRGGGATSWNLAQRHVDALYDLGVRIDIRPYMQAINVAHDDGGSDEIDF